MKKPTYQRREWHRRRARNEAKRRKLKVWLRLIDKDQSSGTPTKSFTTAKGTRLVRMGDGDRLPAILSFKEAPEDTLAFFANLRIRTLTGKRSPFRHVEGGRKSRIGWVRAYSDFTPLQMISPSASLVLASEYDQVQRVTGKQSAAIDLERWNPEVVPLHPLWESS